MLFRMQNFHILIFMEKSLPKIWGTRWEGGGGGGGGQEKN